MPCLQGNKRISLFHLIPPVLSLFCPGLLATVSGGASSQNQDGETRKAGVDQRVRALIHRLADRLASGQADS